MKAAGFSFNALLIVSLFITLFSCNQQSSPAAALVAESTEQTSKDSFELGKVISPLVSHTDASQSYALFLPSAYFDSARLPVIIFFDPHADGSLPLNLYHSLANDYGFILVGSNNSKNGMSSEQSEMLANNLITEVKTRFKIDEKRITLCGFSGGAKVALLAAADNKSVSSVIYCGAALSVTPTHPLRFLGFAGNRDMNYTDVVSFAWDLMSSSAKYLIEWNGKHEFPDTKTFQDAFIFLTTGTVPDYENKMVSINPQKLVEEQNKKLLLLKAFKTQDINWWKNEINLMIAKRKTNAMYERLLGFVSLACYSYASQSLEQNNLIFAEKILAIYESADPGNKDCAEFFAELNRRKAGN